MPTELQHFLRSHPIFTYDTFVEAMQGAGSKNPLTIRNKLNQHISQAHIIRIRRELFAAIPYGAEAERYPINPFLITGYLAPDAVIAYHTALAFYGLTYSSSYRFIYLTEHQTKILSFRQETYQPTLFPKALLIKNAANAYVNTEDVQGLTVRVTSKERTLVDLMDRPNLGGGWEEIWRSLDLINRFKIDDIIRYTLLLDNATTIAKVGLYLEQRQPELKVSEKQLEQLQAHRPASPHYLTLDHQEKSQYIARWNLMVPLSLIHHRWEENLDWESKI